MDKLVSAATEIELTACNGMIIDIVAAAACGITVTSYEQNGVLVSPNNISVQFDLTVRGTANPDNTNITGMFSVGSTGHSLTIIRTGGMNWHTVIPRAWFPAAGQRGNLQFTKQCPAPPGGQAIRTLTFVA